MPKSTITDAKPAVKRESVEVSDRLFDRVGAGESTVIDAALKFAELVDDVTPLGGEGSLRRKMLNGAFQLADDVAQAQLGLMRSAVNGVVLVNVDVHAFNGTDVDVNVGTNVDTLTRRRQLAAV